MKTPRKKPATKKEKPVEKLSIPAAALAAAGSAISAAGDWKASVDLSLAKHRKEIDDVTRIHSRTREILCGHAEEIDEVQDKLRALNARLITCACIATLALLFAILEIIAR